MMYTETMPLVAFQPEQFLIRPEIPVEWAEFASRLTFTADLFNAVFWSESAFLSDFFQKLSQYGEYELFQCHQ